MATKKIRGLGGSGKNGNKDADRSILSYYLNDISAINVLGHDEQHALAKRNSKGNREARERLIESNLRFVVSIAKEYLGMGLTLAELISEGNIGLVEGIDHYELGHNTRPISYATWWIRRSILRAISEKAQTIRKTLYCQRILRRLRKAEHNLRQKLSRKPDSEELARELQLTVKAIDGLQQTPQDRHDISLDDHLKKLDGEVGIAYGEFIAIKEKNQLDQMILHDEKQAIRKAMRCINPQERIVLERRFGMDGGREQTLKEIGNALGISRERVRQIEREAKKRLRKKLGKMNPPADNASGQHPTQPKQNQERQVQPTQKPSQQVISKAAKLHARRSKSKEKESPLSRKDRHLLGI